MQRPLPAILALLAAILAAPGCSHYRLGTGRAPSFRSIYVEPVANHTLLPQAQAVLSTRLREAFIRDGRVQSLNSSAAADTTLSVVVSDFRREIATVREGDTGLARKFNVTLGVTCTLRDNRTGQALWSTRPISATREVFTDSGQLQAEYQVLPLLADALADRILRATLDSW